MRIDLPKWINRHKWLDRMGITEKPDIEMLLRLAEAEEKLFAASMPQGVYRVMPVEAITPQGEDIRKHLNSCDEVALMGVTLGAMVDKLIRASQIRDMSEAVLLDCGASVLIEQIADEMCRIIDKEQQRCSTVRYSPGYGDYPLMLQTELIWLMDAHRKIGLAVNESYMMTPQKSVTAVIGLSDEPVTGYMATCSECKIKDGCGLVKKGKSCVGL